MGLLPINEHVFFRNVGAAVALAPDQALGGGGFEFTMLAEQLTVRPKVEQGAVERTPAELGVPLNYADGQIDTF